MMRARWMLGLVGLVGLGLAGCTDKSTDDSTPIVTDPPPTAAITGQALFHSLRCVNCHGGDGRGSELFPGAPTLVGRTADDIRVSVVEPCANATSTSNCHPLKIPDLVQEDLDKLAAYLLELDGGNRVEDPGPPCDDVPGNICTIAGNGVAGNRRGTTNARDTYLFWPQNVTVDPQGRLVITDWNNFLLRRVDLNACTADGCPMQTVYGDGTLSDECSTDAKPAIATAGGNNHNITAEFDRFGNIVMGGWHMWKIKYIEVDQAGDPQRIFCMFGNVRGFAGDGEEAGWNRNGMDGPVRFNLPSDAKMDDDGNFYVADQANVRIRKVAADADDYFGPDAKQFVDSRQNNIINTWIGGPNEEGGYAHRTRPDYADSGDGGPISEATLAVDIGFDATPQFRLAIDNPRKLLYIADSNNSRVRVVDLSQDPPTIDTFAGGGDTVEGPNLLATDAKLNRPADIDLVPDGSGDMLITDTFNHCVRYLEYSTRIITTVAGKCGEEGYEGDGGPATEALIYEPGGAYMTADHTVFIADTINHRIRRVNPK